MTDTDPNNVVSNDSAPNMALQYRLAYESLLANATERLRAKVLEAKDNQKEPDAEVREFIKTVIANAERAEIKKL